MKSVRIDRTEIDKTSPAALTGEGMRLRWLGQAGFDVRMGKSRILIDPYLSNDLENKYGQTAFPHHRMMASPIDPRSLVDLDWVLCTHAHGDHMDRGTLPILASNNRRCRFVVPRAEVGAATKCGVPAPRAVGVGAGGSIQLGNGTVLHAIPSAHEQRDIDPNGDDHFLGYVLQSNDLTSYHSGDCIPFEGLAAILKPFHIDVALLPVNGRDARRLSQGFLGNFNFEEAVALCRDVGISTLIVHHFDMFDFNTVDRHLLESLSAKQHADPATIVPDPSAWYTISHQ